MPGPASIPRTRSATPSRTPHASWWTGARIHGIWLNCVAGIAIVGFGLPLAGIYLLQDDQFLPFFAGSVLFAASIGLAGLYRTRLKGRALGGAIALPMFAMAAVLAANLTDLTALEFFLAVTLVLLALAFRTARSIGTRRDQENLRALRAARRYFQRRLRRRGADIDEHWVPYLLAFGLGKDLDRWQWPPRNARATAIATGRGAHDAGRRRRPRRVRGHRARSVPGGAFGGAGASGTWASSIGAFAAVVPAPVSDSSGSSSSSELELELQLERFGRRQQLGRGQRRRMVSARTRASRL